MVATEEPTLPATATATDVATDVAMACATVTAAASETASTLTLVLYESHGVRLALGGKYFHEHISDLGLVLSDRTEG